jgi:hypothetical protein
MFRFAPQRFHGEIVKYFRKFEAFPIADSIAYLRGPWRHLALEKVQENPGELIRTLSERGKLAKLLLINFCSSVSSVNYPKLKLVNMATIMFYESQKVARVRISLRLLNCALRMAGTVSEELMFDLLKSVIDRQGKTSLMELSYLLRILAEFGLPDMLHFYSEQLITLWQHASLVLDNFRLVHLQFFGQFADELISGLYGFEEDRFIRSRLESERPSQFLSGLRMFEVAVARMQDARSVRVVRNITETLLKQFPKYQRIREVSRSAVAILSTILEQPLYGQIHRTIYEGLAFTTALQPGNAAFCGLQRWLIVAVRNCGNFDATLNFVGRVRNMELFELALAVLAEQFRKAPAEQKELMMMDSFFKFLSDHADNQSYYSYAYLSRFYRMFADMKQDALFHFCLNAMKAIRFLPVFLCVARVIRGVGDADWIAALVDQLVLVAGAREHVSALERLKDIRKIDSEALRLASANGN